jgi:adenylate cyclase
MGEGMDSSPEMDLDPAMMSQIKHETKSDLNIGIELVEVEGQRKIKITNRGRSLALSYGARIHRGSVSTVSLPVSFRVSGTQVQIYDSAVEFEVDESLDYLQTIVPEDPDAAKEMASPGPKTLAAWLEALSELQQATAGSDEIFRVAAEAIFTPGGLDGAMILFPGTDGWETRSSFIPFADHGIVFREDLVQRAASSNKAIYHRSVSNKRWEENDLHSAIVCPIQGADGEVVAAIYGFRSLHRRNNRCGIRSLEAQFVQVVADAISAGMIRLRSEAKAAKSLVLLEQVFAPEVVKKLQAHPEFLEGQQREVSVLFADLRGFTEISESLGTHDTYEFLSDVMDRFSKIITDLGGVIIDYYGDGVSAFWNAPIDQPQHPILACKAGMNILKCLSGINDVWQDRLGKEIKVGIGIHTGEARVGNSGSRSRIKYGPRGATVNIASRLENATKQIGSPMLVSGDTINAIEEPICCRRIISKKLKGFSEPTQIFELFPDVLTRPSAEYLKRYEAALVHFENGNFQLAMKILVDLKRECPDDNAVSFLMRCIGGVSVSGNPAIEKAPINLMVDDSTVIEENQLEDICEIIKDASGVMRAGRNSETVANKEDAQNLSSD